MVSVPTRRDALSIMTFHSCSYGGLPQDKGANTRRGKPPRSCRSYVRPRCSQTPWGRWPRSCHFGSSGVPLWLFWGGRACRERWPCLAPRSQKDVVLSLASLQQVSSRSPANLKQVSSRYPAGLQQVSNKSPAGLQQVSSRSPASLH